MFLILDKFFNKKTLHECKVNNYKGGLMSQIVSTSANKFCETVGNKLAKNTTKIKVSLKEILGQEELTKIKEAAKKIEEKTNLPKDVFQKQ